MQTTHEHVDALKDIRNMMKRSSRFISLSGLSGIVAGCWALAGAYFAYDWIVEYYNNNSSNGYTGSSFQSLKLNLFLLALAVLSLSFVSAFYFTWRKSVSNKLPLWDHTSRTLLLQLLIPIVVGGIFIITMLQYNEWRFIAPACLIFYGLGLVNASKYTLSEVYYLGLSEIVLGLICTQFIGWGLYFWVAGFGILHILYGLIMWWRYDRGPQQTSRSES